MSTALKAMDVESYLERSQRSGLLRLFFDEPLPGDEVQTFDHALLPKSPHPLARPPLIVLSEDQLFAYAGHHKAQL